MACWILYSFFCEEISFELFDWTPNCYFQRKQPTNTLAGWSIDLLGFIGPTMLLYLCMHAMENATRTSVSWTENGLIVTCATDPQKKKFTCATTSCVLCIVDHACLHWSHTCVLLHGFWITHACTGSCIHVWWFMNAYSGHVYWIMHACTASCIVYWFLHDCSSSYQCNKSMTPLICKWRQEKEKAVQRWRKAKSICHDLGEVFFG